MINKVVGLIPVRLESSRLPGKALAEIHNIPAIVHTYKRAKLSKKLSDLILCTDSDEIRQAVSKYDVKVEMTKPHINGSERIYEVSKKYGFRNVLNIQGDEVLINPNHIDTIIASMEESSEHKFFIGTTNFNKTSEKNVFKAVLNYRDEMLYCSREDIPSPSITKFQDFKKVVFLVGYKDFALQDFIEWGECDLETKEPNEFLRILYNNEKIKAVYLKNAHISLDTPDDLEVIKRIADTDSLIKLYQ
jgi:3-deoxy-manno-octulosonate cytidylyltransferase (CMP-KDO synthetase)